jgi:hypothetical protein
LLFWPLLKAKLTLARPASSSVARKALAAATVLPVVSLSFAGSTRSAGAGVVLLFFCYCIAASNPHAAESSTAKQSPVMTNFRFIENFL